MEPKEDERICPISYEVAFIRLGGGPDSRPSFWRAYREEYALNRKTKYQNQHTQICNRLLMPVREVAHLPHYFRKGKLVRERKVTVDESAHLIGSDSV
jgi:hypothetical protein